MSDFSLNFEMDYDETSRILSLRLTPSFGEEPLSREQILSAFENSTYNDFYLYESTIDEIINESEKIITKGQKLHQEYLTKLRQIDSAASQPQSADEENVSNESQSAENGSANEQNTPPNSSATSISPEEILKRIGELRLSFDIAECKDANILIGIDEDDSRAYITVEPAFGGDTASEESIRKALGDKGIVFGIKDDVVKQCAQSSQCEDTLIAEGTKPKKGKPSSFRALVSEQITTGPKIDDKGIANYHDINEFVIVEPGTPLMERVQPGKGKPGTDVFGRVISPIPGDELPFSANLTGSEPSPESKDILVATMKGHPVIEDRGVSVSNVLMLKNVGLSTGNVDFDGSVCIDGDVADGVKIKVSGDVTVKGAVGKAEINAGGNIVILQGLIGGSKDPQTGDEDPYGAHITAKGSVSAHFMTRSKINAGKHIVVPEYVSHSHLEAKNQILVGQSSGKGTLFGGKARAFDLVAAKVIGSTGGTPTQIQVGAEGDYIVQLRRVGKQKRLNDQNTYDVNEALHKISLLSKSAGMTPQMKEKAEELSNKLEALQQELKALKAKEEKIKTVLMKSKKSRVIANQKVFNNTSVSILGSQMTIKEEMRGGSFRFEARRVVFEH